MKHRRRPGRPKRESADPPTPETAAKLEPDVLLVLVRNGYLTADQERAAREIDEVYRALQRGLVRCQREMIRGGKQRDVADVLTMAEAEAYSRRYMPWAQAEGKVIVSTGPRLTRAQLAQKICILNRNPVTLASGHNIEPALVVSALKASLDRYWKPRIMTLDKAAST